jgi:hypothetical protein
MSKRAWIVLLCVVIVVLVFCGVPRVVNSETREGTFIIKCTFSHRAQVDPIVSPGIQSDHEHTFTGNDTTGADSTYSTMVGATTTCADRDDTAGYWFPTLRRPDGTPVTPIFSFAYYKNLPVRYGTTQAFPPDFRLIAGGLANPSHTFWDCFNTGGKFSTPPVCSGWGNYLVTRVQFPSCWDGVNLDSQDHRSHMAYGTSSSCPAAFPVKLPRINFFVRWCENCGGPGYVFSDGTTVMHADFWNTWRQSALEALVVRCLNAGINCGQIKTA